LAAPQHARDLGVGLAFADERRICAWRGLTTRPERGSEADHFAFGRQHTQEGPVHLAHDELDQALQAGNRIAPHAEP